MKSWLTSVSHTQLKCSGEPDGCQRCQSKKIECHFPAPAKSSGIVAQTKGSLPSPSEPPPPQTNRVSGTLESPLDYESSIVALTHESVEDDSSFDFEVSAFDPLEDADALLFTVEPSPPEAWQQPSSFTINSAESTFPRNDMSWVGGHMDHGLSSGTNTWASSETSPPPTSSTCESIQFCYTCLAKATKTLEAIEAASWALREKVDYTNEMLHEQKRAMIECKDLLCCQKCVTQPAYIMLVLSICGKILGTLEALCCGIPTAGKDGSADEPCPNPKRRWTGRDSGSGSEFSSHGYRQPIYGYGNRKTQLDNEDELLVLQSLLRARVAKLDGLLGRLHVFITEHNWPAHKGLIRELQDRLIKRPFIIQSIGSIFE